GLLALHVTGVQTWALPICLDLGPGDALGLERAAAPADIHGLDRLDLHQRAAGELDAVIDPAHEQCNDPGQEEHSRQHIGKTAVGQEVVVGVGEESHQMLSVDMAGRRSSQIMKKVRVTKTAVMSE